MPDPMQDGAANFCTVDDIGPVFEVVGQRLKSLEADLSEMKDIMMKIVSGFGDAVTEHKRAGFQSLLSDKHGGDLSELGGPYSDIYGSDLGSDLMDKLMGGELDEEGVGNHIGEIRAKFAKLKGGPVEVEKTESPAEEAKESPEYQAGEEDALKDVAEDSGTFSGPGTDPLKSMMSTLKSAPEILKGRAKRR